MSGSSVYQSLVEPHLEDLRKYCLFLTQSKWDGEDLCQEALLKSMVYFREHEPTQDLKPFLIRVARNLWIDNRRAVQRQKKMPRQTLPLYGTDSNYAEVRSLMEWIGERLPRRNIEMLLLADYFGYTMQEIADMLETTVPAVKSLLFRSRSILKKSKGEDRQKETGKVIPLDVERWSKAVMQDLPPRMQP